MANGSKPPSNRPHNWVNSAIGALLISVFGGVILSAFGLFERGSRGQIGVGATFAALLVILSTASKGWLNYDHGGRKVWGGIIAAFFFLAFIAGAVFFLSGGVSVFQALFVVALLLAGTVSLSWNTLRSSLSLGDVVFGVASLLVGVAALLGGVAAFRGADVVLGVEALLVGVAALLGGVAAFRGADVVLGVEALLVGVASLLNTGSGRVGAVRRWINRHGRRGWSFLQSDRNSEPTND